MVIVRIKGISLTACRSLHYNVSQNLGREGADSCETLQL